MASSRFLRERELYNLHNHDESGLHLRSYDWGTAGGNAYTGATSSASGGDITNYGEGDDSEITNTGGSE